ncbi:MAG TPA: DUF1579 family protein, partial [Thermoanaerobaculia bacterium]
QQPAPTKPAAPASEPAPAKPAATPAAPAPFEPPSGPGAGQAYLKTFEGDWDVEKVFYPPAGGAPSRSGGDCVQKMVQDGRFLESRFTFRQDGKTTTGVGVSGFESSTGLFTTVWYDSRQTRMSIRQSREPFDGKQIVLFGVSLDPSRSRGRESKTISHLEDGGRRLIHRQYSVGEGPDRLVMELILTRKK